MYISYKVTGYPQLCRLKPSYVYGVYISYIRSYHKLLYAMYVCTYMPSIYKHGLYVYYVLCIQFVYVTSYFSTHVCTLQLTLHDYFQQHLLHITSLSFMYIGYAHLMAEMVLATYNG